MSDVQRQGFTLSIAMATGKLPLLLRVNSALKEHLGNITKQQFALWQPRLSARKVMVKPNKLPSTASTSQDSGKLQRLKNRLFGNV